MLAPTIAVVHTDPPFLNLLHEFLSDEGNRILLLSMQDAVAAVRHEMPALLILDLWVDVRQDGWNLLLQLRGDAATTDIPAILFAEDAEFTARKAAALAVMGCTMLNKPFELGDLLAAIETRIGASPATTVRERHAYPEASMLFFPADGYALRVQRDVSVAE